MIPEVKALVSKIVASEVLTPGEQRRALSLLAAVELYQNHTTNWQNILYVAQWIYGIEAEAEAEAES